MSNTHGMSIFNERFPDLHRFILELVDHYQVGVINSWTELDQRVHAYFTPARMEQMESVLPHWKKMASYSEGVTQTHVMCVFLGLYMLPEYQSMTPAQQNMMQWVILLHDLEKDIKNGRRDQTHAFRSAATAAQRLADFGFETTSAYPTLIGPWSKLVLSSAVQPEDETEPIQDNSRLPEILEGIDHLFGAGSPAAAITKTVLLHLSITVVRDWPQAAPLTADEIARYIDRELLPLLEAMMLSDNEGWSLFSSNRATQRSETIKACEEIGTLIP